jgi:hypothetical protein
MIENLPSLKAWLAAPPERAPARLPIFVAEPPRFKAEMLPRLANMFHIRPNPEQKPHQGIHLQAQDGRLLAFYEASGAFTFTDAGKLNNPAYRPSLPRVEEAAAIARKFLQEHELLSEDLTEDGAQVVNLEQVKASGEKRERSITPNHIVVNFRQKVGELLTYGPGGRIQVCLGERGEVIGMVHAVRKYRRHAELRLRTPAALQQILALKLGQPLENVALEHAQLVYYAESFVKPGQYLQPVYIFNLVAEIKTRRQPEPARVKFMTHPISATDFGPQVRIRARGKLLRRYQGDDIRLESLVRGGTSPYRIVWSSDVDGMLGEGPALATKKLSIAHRGKKITAHTIQVEVTDANGLQDSYAVLLRIMPRRGTTVLNRPVPLAPDDPDDPYVGVEWCNLYHGSAPDISGTNPSAQGFKNGIDAVPNWSSRFDWGNDNAWEQDFKFQTAPGGGEDYLWSDNVHFVFFAGHGSPGAFYFGSTTDDHQMVAADAHWGEGLLNWVVLHACQTMRNNFDWTVWCDSFRGLHQMFGFHTNTEGSDPPLGTRFALWLSFNWFGINFDMRTAWRQACSECFDASVEYAMIYANQAGTDTHNDHLPGVGYVSPDPTNPNVWAYTKASC